MQDSVRRVRSPDTGLRDIKYIHSNGRGKNVKPKVTLWPLGVLRDIVNDFKDCDRGAYTQSSRTSSRRSGKIRDLFEPLCSYLACCE